ncbi:hypothetical protein SAMN05421837_104676 [Amycolatopsis pretoriensis]|uniref:Zinc ribbon domain-containing protein n=1 Tax=Amycolatopsis pretoriensis TaxID=218821 RepID=A0A1H5QTF0_9PSEU|nr:hypothetical protein [Amycolatopsis pretoriensis]SEF29393.1 hypothetical protein SAMN05421837_104676 [Amycolatopsis pretoriensis]
MAEDEVVCPHCRTPAEPGIGICPQCGVTISITPRGATRIHVVGRDATEVEAVSRQLSASAFERREARRLRSPWFSGLFYLTVVVVVVALLLVAGRVLALWALPVVVIGAVLLVTVVGAFQLRADDRLAERNFVKLMGDVLRRLPSVFTRSRAERPDD